MPASDTPVPTAPLDEPRAFVLRVRVGLGAEGRAMVVTVDDVQHQRIAHFADLDTAFAAIRSALTRPGPTPGQTH